MGGKRIPSVFCSCCGKLYKPRSNSQASAEIHYCSSECQCNGQRKNPDTVCQICGSMFVSNDDHRIYCSKKCAVIASRKYTSKQERKQAERQRAKERRKSEIEARQLQKAEERAIKIALLQEEKKRARTHSCIVCGNLTTRPKYCSDKCCNNAGNNRRMNRRRAKINAALIDKDITLMDVYKNDMGVCYICGRSCSWDDKIEKNGTIICGQTYPSIDHVIPLSKGGMHSWGNVRLSCRECNWKKSDILPRGAAG